MCKVGEKVHWPSGTGLPRTLSVMMGMFCYCVEQRTGHYSHVATEHLKCGQCDGGTELPNFTSL